MSQPDEDILEENGGDADLIEALIDQEIEKEVLLFLIFKRGKKTFMSHVPKLDVFVNYSSEYQQKKKRYLFNT